MSDQVRPQPPQTARRKAAAVVLFAAIGVGIALSVSSCGGDEEIGYPEITVNEPTAEALATGATLAGTVSWTGKVPKRTPISMGSDPYCRESGSGKVTERVVVGANGGLRDVLIHVTKGLDAWTFDWVKEEALIDQANCVYLPHVAAVRTYQPVVFRNDDATTHNVNTRGSSQGFNKTTSSKGTSYTHQFKSAELGIRAKCDIHPWMNAWVHVLDHPYFAITDDTGKWTFPRALPPGTYTVEARHPTEGKKTAEITIEAGKAPLPLEFRFND